MPAEPKDPVASPETVAASSPAPQSAPVATPEPAGGVPATPPVASDKAPVSTPTKAAIPEDPSKGESPIPLGVKPLGEGDALDRLTAPETKTEPVTSPVAKTETPVSDDTENKEAPEAADDAPFAPADEKELAGYHSRTRRRLGQYHKEMSRQKPYVEFAESLVNAAAENNLSVPAILEWQKLGFGIRNRDPEALESLENLLDSHGRTAPAQAAPDMAPIEAVIAKLHRSMNLDDEGKAALEAALSPFKKPAAPVQRQAAPQQQQRQAAPQQQAPNPMAQTANWVKAQEAQLAAAHGQKWPELKQAIYAEAARREANLPSHIVNDPIELRVRFAACAAHVQAKASAPKPVMPSVQPSLRGNTSPTLIPVPQRGTPEYDDLVMTHGVPPKA